MPNLLFPLFQDPREPFFLSGLEARAAACRLHTHGAVFAEVLYGRKRWFVTAPMQRPSFDPQETSFVFL
jgi:hypothetical protein